MNHKGPADIEALLREYPKGLNIGKISEKLSLNRITLAKYLDIMTAEGKLEMRVFGRSKIFLLTRLAPDQRQGETKSNLVLILDHDFNVVMCNTPFLDFTGLSKERTIGASIFQLRGDLIEKIVSFLKTSYSRTENILEVSLNRDSRVFHFAFTLTHMEFIDGLGGWEIIAEDITRRKTAEIDLLQTEQKYKALVEQVSEASITIDRKGTITSYTRIRGALTDYDPGEVVHHNIREFISPDMPKDILESLLDIRYYMDPVKNNMPVSCRIRTKRNEDRWHEVIVSPDYNTDHKVTGFSLAIRDINALRMAYEEIHNRERFLNAILDTYDIPQFGIGFDHTVLFWNEAMEYMTGTVGKTVIGTKNHALALYSHENACFADIVLENAIKRRKYHALQTEHLNLSHFEHNRGTYSAVEFFDNPNLAGNKFHINVKVLMNDSKIVGAVQQFIEFGKYIP